MAALKFACPSCGRKFAPVETSDSATHVVQRTCSRCHERWQLVVQGLAVKDDYRIDKATLTFLGKKVL